MVWRGGNDLFNLRLPLTDIKYTYGLESCISEQVLEFVYVQSSNLDLPLNIY